MSRVVVATEKTVTGDILCCGEGLSFWGGVNASTSVIQDQQHPQSGHSLAGRIVMMPTSRGSCSGAGVLVGLALSGRAPAALVFRDAEVTLTLGALVAKLLFDKRILVVQLGADDYDLLSTQSNATVYSDQIVTESVRIALERVRRTDVRLDESDRRILAGEEGEAAQIAMEIVLGIASIQGAKQLTDISRVHIDGCIYAHRAFLLFAEKMLAKKAKVRVPTTLNAISIDYDQWRHQKVDPEFASAARRLAQCYVEMGAQPTFTCAPYQLDDRPRQGENIAWAESNAVVYANSVLGARTEKHPDFLDLCIAVTGRTPDVGVYNDSDRAPQRVVYIEPLQSYDDSFWPLIGWLLGEVSPHSIPLVRGLEESSPDADDLKALCAAFGTTSAAPLLHVAGVTPEATHHSSDGLPSHHVSASDMLRAWKRLNSNDTKIDLVAMGSPHFSLAECERFLTELGARHVHADVSAMITTSRATRALLKCKGVEQALTERGVQVISDVCWCSITEPVFPSDARVLVTNSAKYAHYGPGLSGRSVRFGGMSACANAAVEGRLHLNAPTWLRS